MLKRLWDTENKKMVFVKWPSWHDCQVWTDADGSHLYIYDCSQWIAYNPAAQWAESAKEYDVVVCGGGTAGVAAALAAARQGASVLILERSFFIGGMLTEGNAGITKFTDHCRDAMEYKKEVIDTLATDP